jgi:hypothetical protein
LLISSPPFVLKCSITHVNRWAVPDNCRCDSCFGFCWVDLLASDYDVDHSKT